MSEEEEDDGFVEFDTTGLPAMEAEEEDDQDDEPEERDRAAGRVVLVSHLPHGFFEDQISAFFSTQDSLLLFFSFFFFLTFFVRSASARSRK